MIQTLFLYDLRHVTPFVYEYIHPFTAPWATTYLFIAVPIIFLMGGRMEPVTELIEYVGVTIGILGAGGVWTMFGVLAYNIVDWLRHRI